MWVIGILLALVAVVVTLWWMRRNPGEGLGVRLNRAAGKLALLTAVLVGCTLLCASGPPVVLGTLTSGIGVLAVATILGWGTAAWLLRPRLPLWLLGCGWVVIAALGSWIVGYALALRGNPARFIDGRLTLAPFAFGAWFAALVLVAGVLHLRWLRSRRNPGPTDPAR